MTYASLFNSKTHLVFCDVGQGDGIYLRIKNKFDVVIDSGPNSAILDCLGKYMPFYDRKIELAILTNSDSDHFTGFLPLLKRFEVQSIIMPPHNKLNTSFQQFLQEVMDEKSEVIFPTAGDKFNILGTSMDFYWPTSDFISSNVVFLNLHKAQALKDRLGSTNRDTNEFSFIFMFIQGSFRALFTGDAPPQVLEQVGQYLPFSNGRKINLLKVPHHGSKNGLTYEFLRLADPTLSVISVGKQNRYHFPSPEVLGYFKALKKNYLRTDEKGDINFWIN